MTEKQSILEEFRELTIHLAAGSGRISRAFRDDIAGREIVATPYDGCYGLAGWIIVVNGSPPRCTIIVERRSESPVVFVAGRSRRLGSSQTKIVRRFVETTLANRTERLAIDGKLAAVRA